LQVQRTAHRAVRRVQTKGATRGQINVAAQRFYERHGFVCVQTTDGSRNDERAPDMRYVFEPPIT
jgi:hypothetical protein